MTSGSAKRRGRWRSWCCWSRWPRRSTDQSALDALKPLATARYAALIDGQAPALHEVFEIGDVRSSGRVVASGFERLDERDASVLTAVETQVSDVKVPPEKCVGTGSRCAWSATRPVAGVRREAGAVRNAPVGRLSESLLRRAGYAARADAPLALQVVAGPAALAVVAVAVLGWAVYRDAADRADRQEVLDRPREHRATALPQLGVPGCRPGPRPGALAEPFAAQFRSTAADMIAPATRERQLLTRAKAVRVAIIEYRPDEAFVLVYLNQITTSAVAPGPPEVSASQVRETLTKVDDRWLISGFEVL